MSGPIKVSRSSPTTHRYLRRAICREKRTGEQQPNEIWHVDTPLIRLLAMIEITFSNSLIEPWWRRSKLNR